MVGVEQNSVRFILQDNGSVTSVTNSYGGGFTGVKLTASSGIGRKDGSAAELSFSNGDIFRWSLSSNELIAIKNPGIFKIEVLNSSLSCEDK